MRLFFFTITLLFVSGLHAVIIFEAGFKYDLIRDYQISKKYFEDNISAIYNFDYDKHGYSFYANLPFKVNDNFRIGPGVQFQTPRTAYLKEYHYSSSQSNELYPALYRWHEYYFIPVYINSQLSMLTHPVSVEISYKLGCNFMLSSTLPLYVQDLKGGLYYSVGLGFNYKRCGIAVQYDEDKGVFESGIKDYKVLCRQIGITASVKMQNKKK